MCYLRTYDVGAWRWTQGWRPIRWALLSPCLALPTIPPPPHGGRNNSTAKTVAKFRAVWSGCLLPKSHDIRPAAGRRRCNPLCFGVLSLDVAYLSGGAGPALRHTYYCTRRPPPGVQMR